MTDASLRLIHHPEDLAVVRLDAHAVVPEWAMDDSPLVSVTVTSAETSVVCLAASVPHEVKQAGPYQTFELADSLDIALVGILAAVISPVADAGISAFNVSTFSTNWILVPSNQADRARDAWVQAGHIIEEPYL